MKYYVKVPVAGYIEVAVKADDEDAAIEQALEAAQKCIISVKAPAAPENYNFEYLHSLEDAAVPEVEVEELDEDDDA